ncbi:SPRY-domain-containing protein [Gigaspora margarita]|uniref:SPRY-domain-containing protein n=1 Tax=Gigaspora margarita TaxID=4874 RepID=A0A8H4A0H8_GIGMA|nr:SPRY-domain-containing protein [Gigaspora margarita]
MFTITAYRHYDKSFDLQLLLIKDGIDSSGLEVNYTDPSDYKAVVIRSNNPIPSQFGLFYFEIEIINEGKNGMIGVGYCTKQSDISVVNAYLIPGLECVKDDENKENNENNENKSWG